MANYPDIDAYIAQSEDFAQPILSHLRALVHEACPGVEETFKWNMPHFLYKEKILCSMASFKQHAAFTFWLGASMSDPQQLFQRVGDSGMGQLGKIQHLSDLPDREILISYLHEAVLLTDAGTTISGGKSKKGKVLETPEYLREALLRVPAAMDCFEKFSQSHRNEYIEWITEAKAEATRQRRIAQMIEWLKEGKSRNWKYVR
jgi:uncharacterized protein YdeI (YjbR/CyaY-like superfamily)